MPKEHYKGPGCEYSHRTRELQRGMIDELFGKLTDIHKEKFTSLYGPISMIEEGDMYRIYQHCKRVLKSKRDYPEESA
ncbi:MAG: hypothetical protein ACYST3_09370 [Planctomycetota bacterium]|jgi:hypothetical protein